MVEDLLDMANTLAVADGRRPRQISLRRAISNAYYAVFHALAQLCADELVGVTKHSSPAWIRVYRALEHGFAKNALKANEVTALNPGVKDFADAFLALQDLRHIADYDPRPFPYRRRATQAAIAQARNAITKLNAIDPEIRRVLATYVS